jgi:hypothetical protein
MEAEKAALDRQDEYRQNMNKFMTPVADTEKIEKLSTDLEKKTRSESKWQRECHSLVLRLDQEVHQPPIIIDKPKR